MVTIVGIRGEFVACTYVVVDGPATIVILNVVVCGGERHVVQRVRRISLRMVLYAKRGGVSLWACAMQSRFRLHVGVRC